MNMAPGAVAIHPLSMQITPQCCCPGAWKMPVRGAAAMVLNRRSCWLTGSCFIQWCMWIWFRYVLIYLVTWKKKTHTQQHTALWGAIIIICRPMVVNTPHPPLILLMHYQRWIVYLILNHISCMQSHIPLTCSLKGGHKHNQADKDALGWQHVKKR